MPDELRPVDLDHARLRKRCVSLDDAELIWAMLVLLASEGNRASVGGRSANGRRATRENDRCCRGRTTRRRTRAPAPDSSTGHRCRRRLFGGQQSDP